MQPKNWLIRVYLRNKEIDAWQIENRNDNEAFNEAAADVARDYPQADDWSITEV